MAFYVDADQYRRMKSAELDDVLMDFDERTEPQPKMPDFGAFASGILERFDRETEPVRQNVADFGAEVLRRFDEETRTAAETAGRAAEQLAESDFAEPGGVQRAVVRGAGDLLGRIGEEFETEGASVAAGITNVIQSEFNRSQRVKSEGVALAPRVRAGGTGEPVQETNLRTSVPEGMGTLGFRGVPEMAETVLGGAERTEALERARRFREENPAMSFIGEALAPAGFSIEAARGAAAAAKLAGVAGVGLGMVRRAKGPIEAAEAASTIRPFGRVEEGAAARAPFEEAAAVPRPVVPRATTEARAAELDITPDLVERAAAQPLAGKAELLTAIRQRAAGLWEKYGQVKAELEARTLAGETAENQMADIVVKQGILAQAKRAAEAVTEAAKREASETGRALNSMLIAVNGRLADRVAIHYGQLQGMAREATGEIATAVKKGRPIGKDGQGKLDDLRGYLEKEAEGTAVPEVVLPESGRTATEATAAGRAAARPSVTPQEAARAARTVKAVDSTTQLWRRYVELNAEAGRARLGEGTRPLQTIEAERAAVRDELFAKVEEAERARMAKPKKGAETAEEAADAAKDRMAAGIRATWARQVREKTSPFKEPKFAGDVGQQIEDDLMKAMAKEEQRGQVFIAKTSVAIEKEINAVYDEIRRNKVRELTGAMTVSPERRKAGYIGIMDELKQQILYGTASKAQERTVLGLIRQLQDLGPEGEKAARRMEGIWSGAREARTAAIAGEAKAGVQRAIRTTARETLDLLDRFQKAAPGTPEYRQAANDVLMGLSRLGTDAKAEMRRHYELANRAKVRRLLTEEERNLPAGQRAERVDELARQLARFTQDDWSDPRGFQMFANSMKKEGAFEKAHRWRLGSMLSGVPTMILNLAGSGVETAIAPAVRGIAGVAERVAPVQKGVRNAAERMAVDEVEGWVEGFGTAASEFRKTWVTGVGSRIRADVQGQAVGSMRNPLAWPLRMLQATDDFWYTLNFGSALKAEMRVESLKTGKSMSAIRLDLLHHPEVVDRAAEQAARRTYTQEVGDIGKAINKLRENPVGKTVVPFFNTIANMTAIGAERSLLPGAGGLFQAGKFARAGDFERAANRRAEGILGASIMAAAGFQAANGNITGFGPTDPKNRKDWLDQGNQPYSVRIGNQWVSYANWGSLIIPLAISASAVEAVREGAEKGVAAEPGEAVTAALIQAARGFGGLWLDVYALRGFSEALNALTDPERYGDRFLESIAISYTSPGFASSLARVFDPEQKDPQGPLQLWLSRAPGLSRQIKPRLTQLGEPITRQTGPGALLPLRTKTASPSPVLQEYERLRGKGQDIGLGKAGETIEGVKLTAEEAFEYQRRAGRLSNLLIKAAMADPVYRKLPPKMQAEELEKARDEARELARIVIKAKAGPRFEVRKIQAEYGLAPK